MPVGLPPQAASTTTIVVADHSRVPSDSGASVGSVSAWTFNGLSFTPSDHLFDPIAWMHAGDKLLGRVVVGDEAFDAPSPAQPRRAQIVAGHLEVAAGGIHAADHDLVGEDQLPQQPGGGNLEQLVGGWNAGEGVGAVEGEGVQQL